MAITLDGTTGITTPGLTNTGTETIVSLTTTGNTILGDATSDTLTVGVTGIVKDASGNVGIGTASPADKLHVAISSSSLGGIRVQNTNAGGQAALSYYNDAATQKADIWWNNSGSTLNLRTLSTDPMIFYTNNAECMRIDSSGNVGIGGAPTQKLDVYGGAGAATSIVRAASGQNAFFSVMGNGNTFLSTSFDIIQDSSNLASIAQRANAAMAFSTNNTERMRITSGGYVLVGTTTIPSPNGILGLKNPSHATIWGSGPDTNGAYLVYNSSSVGVYLGSGNTAWSSSSDERIKTAITPFENALEKVCTLRAGTGRYLKDEETVSRSFLIAQDVQAVLPEAVNVQNDEIGTLGLQYTDVIPLLVAAIKEQQALITALTARITALETP